MIKKSKRNIDSSEKSYEAPKKLRKTPSDTKPNLKKQNETQADSSTTKEKKPKFPTKTKFGNRDGKFKKPFGGKPNKDFKSTTEKTDWKELKKQKKELKIKRKKSKGFYEISAEAKKIAEELRKKELKANTKERSELTHKLDGMFTGKEYYAKFVLLHDMSRIVQYLLKFGSEDVRRKVSKELIPVSVEMLQSKYGRYCFKSMLKHGNNEIRSAGIKALYGNAIKLTSHAVSSAIFEYAYTTWASPQQKQHLIQEFFGEMYKQTKDDKVKHLKDVYENSPTMKTAALQATKANLTRVLNKDLLDSALVHSVLFQFLTVCSDTDRAELIGQLAEHVVILSNSKDGVRVAMQCIWNGSNKERKVAMKAIKEHAVELSKHEFGHCTLITLLDATDDTVLLNKMIVAQILSDIEELVKDEWGRKVLLWLVAPADTVHFHPIFIQELEEGRKAATSKKGVDVRRKELQGYTVPALLQLIDSKPEFWLSSASIAMVTLAVLKLGLDYDTENALVNVAKTITDPEWSIKEEENDITGIEHSGLHMMLKKLAQHDKLLRDSDKMTFGKAVLDVISDETVKRWLKLNRGCFLLVVIYENGTESTQEQMKLKFEAHVKLLKEQDGQGAKLLLKKLS